MKKRGWMKKSNYINLWPTVIGEYYLNDMSIHNELESHIKSSFFSSLSISIFDTPDSDRFKLWVISCVDDYLTNINFKSDNIQITRAWANSLEYLDAQPVHSHTNTSIAGVYYLETTSDHPPLEIFDPRNDHVFNKTFTYTKNGEPVSYVSSTYITPEKFKLILIPAYLRHSVGYNLCKNPRVSVAMNIQV
jgi:hypothetical protein